MPPKAQLPGVEPQREDPRWLIWSKQLKVEHTHLQGRMNDVETKHGTYDARIRSVEVLASKLRNGDGFSALNDRIEDIQHAEQDLRDLFGEHHVQIQKDSEKTTKFGQRLSALETKFARQESEVANLSACATTIKEGIEAVEAKTKDQEHVEQLLNENDSRLRTLHARVDNFDSLQIRDAGNMQHLHDRLVRLERTCHNLQVHTQELEIENARLKTALRSSVRCMPSSEATPEPFPSSDLGNIQVAASPLPRPSNERGQAVLQAESPALNAQQRITARAGDQAHVVPAKPTVDQPAGRRAATVNASKKRKQVVACDECRRKKRRCNAIGKGVESCSHCINAGIPCLFNGVTAIGEHRESLTKRTVVQQPGLITRASEASAAVAPKKIVQGKPKRRAPSARTVAKPAHAPRRVRRIIVDDGEDFNAFIAGIWNQN